MKKVVLLGMLGALTLVSCRKNRTCECTHTDGEVTSSIIVNQKKKAAKNLCTAQSTSYRDCKLQ